MAQNEDDMEVQTYESRDDQQDVNMYDFEELSNTPAGHTNSAAGVNTDVNPVLQSAVTTQPSPFDVQTLPSAYTPDHQGKLYPSLAHFMPPNLQQPPPAAYSDSTVGTPDLNGWQNLQPQQHNGGSTLVDQVQHKSVDASGTSDDGKVQSDTSDTAALDLYRSPDNEPKSEGGPLVFFHPDATQLDLYRSCDNEPKGDGGSKKQTPDPTQPQEMSEQKGAGATGGPQPSAPPDIAKLYIKVEWTPPPQEKRKTFLRIALQTWFSTVLFGHVKEKYTIENLLLTSDGHHAEVDITPSKALDVLKNCKTATVTLKDNSSAVVHFLEKDKQPATTSPVNTKPEPLNPELPVDKKKGPTPEVDMFINAVIDLDKWPQEVQTELLKRMGKYRTGNKLAFSGSLVEVERFYTEVCKIVGGPKVGMNADAVRNNPGTSGAPPALITPLYQYWYFSHAYRKEIDEIQAGFGVKINTEVSVSVTAEDQTRPESVRKASDKLTDLYQNSTTSLQSLTIPQTQLDSELVKDVVRNIHLDQAKMAIMMSVDGCVLSGPKNTISGVQSRLNSEPGQERGTSVGSSSAGKMEIERSYTSGSSTLEMDIKDTPDPIVMSDALWKLMIKTSRKQFIEIENKYGVHISDQPVEDSTKIKVMIKSKDDQRVNLESHAHRAFIHLYQKISMSAITCPLYGPLDKSNFKNELEGHRLVGVDEKIGIWKLVGLPRNLAPAIADIEKLVGKSVFNDKTKKLIEYSENSHKFSSHNWKHLEGASYSAMGAGSSVDPEVKADSGNSKHKESDESKDEDCPICMDKFTDEKKLKCGHGFCRDCLKRSEKSLGEICPVCKKIYGKLRGNQPKGKMTHFTYGSDLPGYPRCGTIEINYDIPYGFQTDDHPNPGQSYSGAQRRAYLPNNAEGNEVLQLLRRAFDQRLIFTVGTSTTTGAQNTVTWNDIHHKTNMTGGPENYGYPDPDYLKRVKEELKAKGVE